MKDTKEQPTRLYTLREASHLLGYISHSSVTMYRLIQTGKLKAMRKTPKGDWWVTSEDLREAITQKALRTELARVRREKRLPAHKKGGK